MKKFLLIATFLTFLISVNNIKAATFNVNPIPSCVAVGQVINPSWGQSSYPSAHHYAVGYRIDGSTPPPYNTTPGAWSIGHDFGGIGTTNRNWTVPNLPNVNVVIWVEVHKNNHDRLEIASSNSFTIKTTCSTSPPPPASKPPPPPPPVAPPSETEPVPDTPIVEEPLSPEAEFEEQIPGVTPVPSQESNANDLSVKGNSNKTRIPKIFGVVYLVSVGLIVLAGFGYAILHKKLIVNKLNLPQLEKPHLKVEIKNVPMIQPKPKPKIKEKLNDYDGELTINDLNKLRKEESLPDETN